MENRFETFAGSVLELNRCIQKIKEAEMRKFGLKAGHTMCLYYLGQHPEGLSSAQLTGLCKEDKAAVSRCLGQLSEKELVFCDLPENKRSYRTLHFLTGKGKAIVCQINERIESALCFGGSGLTEQQRAVFYEAMGVILGNLSRYKEAED